MWRAVSGSFDDLYRIHRRSASTLLTFFLLVKPRHWQMLRTGVSETRPVGIDKGRQVRQRSPGRLIGRHQETVIMLLDKGADVNAQGGDYGNALQAASYGGHREIGTLLSDKGADVNAQGGLYGNAPQAASQRGYQKTVELLQRNGTVASSKQPSEETLS